MANTYSQIHIQTVFAVQDRLSLIRNEWKDRLSQYMTAVLQNKGHKMLAIGGMADHIHLFFGFRPEESLSLLVQELKRCSALWINNQHLVKGRFSWQVGYGAFSYSKSQIPVVCNYIENQEEHHKRQSFIGEYVDILTRAGVEYDPRYIFKDIYHHNQ
ncbi:MAG: IS200/IS605 family transposase [Bacteroidales bacterium]|nr:IS200/IS605 family transposase [Bacteroidales bacterium]